MQHGPNCCQLVEFIQPQAGTLQKCQDLNSASENYFLKRKTIMLAELLIILRINTFLTHNILIDYFRIVFLHEFTITILT